MLNLDLLVAIGLLLSPLTIWTYFMIYPFGKNSNRKEELP